MLLLFFFSLQAFALPYDLTFDIDGTIAYLLKPGNPEAETGTIITLSNGERYRLTDHTEEILGKLKQDPRYRVSFFSGGKNERNIELLEKIRLADGTSAKDMAYKILGFDDLSANPEALNGAHFSDRWKKDLKKINLNLSDVILIDDIQKFVPKEQAKNVLWIESSNFYSERFDPNFVGSKWFPTSNKEFQIEREKLLWAWDRIQSATAIAETEKRPLSEAIFRITHNANGEFEKRLALPAAQKASLTLTLKQASNGPKLATPNCNSMYNLLAP